MDVLKILVVGPPKVGKTNLILSLLNEDLRMSEQNSSFQGTSVVQNHQRDFVLKIIRLNGKKIRVQLWDVTGGSTPETAYAPLFIRNSVGCIIVSNPSSPRFVQEVTSWKQAFDKYTQVPNCSPFPTALFMNHMTPGEIAEPIEVSKTLEDTCRELQEKNNINGVYHVSSMTKENVEKSFAEFVERILYDQEANQRTMSMIDDLWDESIKVKKRAFNNQPEQREHTNNDQKSQGKPAAKMTPTRSEVSPRADQQNNRPIPKQSQQLDPSLHVKSGKQKKKGCCKSQ